jgi:hypothetical protein
MRQVQVRRWMIVVVLAAMFSMPAAAFVVGSQVNNNCKSVHKIVAAGSRILDAERSLKDARRLGLVTQRQYDEQLARIRAFRPYQKHNLAIWRSADCQ